MWSEVPYPDCPVNCYRHQVKLNNDSTWYKAGNYNGHFKKTDTIHLFFVAPGPFAYFYDAEKISPIGIADYQKTKVICYLYPNPANDEIRVIVSDYDKPLAFLLYDAMGRLCKEEKFTKLGNWRTEGLSPGLYYVRIKGEKTLFTEKIIILGE